MPTLLEGEALGGAAAVLVAAAGSHTVALMVDGVLWAWGWGVCGQLGLGNTRKRLVPARVGAEEVFGGSQLLMVACGTLQTLTVTENGDLWWCGEGPDAQDTLVRTQVEAQHFGNAKIVSAAAGDYHYAAVTDIGTLYTWGKGIQGKNTPKESPAGLGHADGVTKMTPTLVAPHLLQGARVGRCHALPPLHALAFAMGTHSRMGSAVADNDTHCECLSMPGELLQRIVDASSSWLEGPAGEMGGMVRMLGGGMIRARGGT